MRHRDWGSGEDSPRERRPSGSWDEPAGPRRVDSYAPESYRTPSRRRAIERGQDEPVDTYLPRWALESGVSRADGGGRHAAPDDDEIEVETPSSEGGWRTEAGRRRRDRPAPRAIGAGPLSDHTAEWTMDAPQERGYVGNRRADSDDEPVSGVSPRSRPRRAATRRPQVTWSGLPDSAGSGDEEAARDSGRSGGRRRSASGSSWPPPVASDSAWSRSAVPGSDRSRPAASDADWPASAASELRRPASESESGWSQPASSGRSSSAASESTWSRSAAPSGTDRTRPAADPWQRRRAADREPPEPPPAVDPWDASGVHAWERSAPGGRWEQAERRWDRTEHTGEWDRFTDTGYLEPVRDEVDPWDRTAPPVREGWASPERAEAFWSGTRLAGDDPRWMETPPSAPRSPAVAYSAPRPRAVPRGRPVAPAGSTLRRRVETIGGGSWGRRLEDDLLDPDPGGPLRPLVYTVACYMVPAVLLLVGLLFLSGQPPAGCVTDITGGGCDSPRTHALDSLVSAAPRFGLALVSSLVVAVLLRQVGTTWRSATVALAAAVVGGGLSTVVISAVTGNPLG
ncbi:hypothetical protein [Micromonospora chalcea]|uniref:hypothetical protein n=1 Tax=Micromonospora chalcea TaxID=1874 RepID=UPI0004C3C312|nr:MULTISPECIES: hypothetical protein [Micromonospora]